MGYQRGKTIMIRIHTNPYEEQALPEAQLIREVKHITCPHCQHGMEWLELDNYDEKLPPLHNTMVLTWDCTYCCQVFITEHEIDKEGCIIIPDGVNNDE